MRESSISRGRSVCVADREPNVRLRLSIGHWKDESQAVSFLHNLGLINANLIDSHAVLSVFRIRRHGWQRKLLPIADEAIDCQRSAADVSPEMLLGTDHREINVTRL